MMVLARFLFLGLLLYPSHGFAEDCGERFSDCVWLDELKQQKLLPFQASLSLYNIHTYCSEGLNKHMPRGYLYSSWSAMYVTITADPTDGLNIADGNSSAAVKEKLKEGRCLPPSSTSTVLEWSLYDTSCVGIQQSETICLHDTVWYRIDAKEGVVPMYPTFFGLGVVLLFSAPLLCRNRKTLYYGTGITITVLPILLYVFSKFAPKTHPHPQKSLFGLRLLAGGYTLFVSLLYWLINNGVEFALVNWQYMATALIIFAVQDAVSNFRSLDLLQWTVQLVAVAILFSASPHVEVSVGFVVTALLLYWIPYRCNPVFVAVSLVFQVISVLLHPFLWCGRCLSWLNPLRLFQRRPQWRFLTMEEYEQQGQVETERALKELREHCRNSGMWDTISNLKNPKRFTEFLSGRDHVSPQQRVEHEWSFVVADSSESDTDDYSDREDPTPP